MCGTSKAASARTRQHIAREKINGLEKGAAYLLNKVGAIGERTQQWAEAMVTARGIAGTRVLARLLALTKKHSSETLEKACEIALANECWHLQTIAPARWAAKPIKQATAALLGRASADPSTRTITPRWSHGRSIARQIAHPWAKVLKGMTRAFEQRLKTTAPRARARRAVMRRRSALDPVIPRRDAPQQSPTPFHQTVPL